MGILLIDWLVLLLLFRFVFVFVALTIKPRTMNIPDKTLPVSSLPDLSFLSIDKHFKDQSTN